MSPTPTIAFIRETAQLDDDQVRSYMASQQVQLDRDLAPSWDGLTAVCVFVAQGEVIPSGAWQCVFLDSSDQADALGYHELTAEDLPLMKIFMVDVLRARVRWTVTASHEVIETLGDPYLTKTTRVLADEVMNEYAWELCDTCEDDQFAYKVEGHWLSDFALPAWFDVTQAGTPGPFTFRHAVPGPFELAAGGYIGYREIAPFAGAWTQRMAMTPGPRQAKPVTSRTLRRFDAAGASP